MSKNNALWGWPLCCSLFGLIPISDIALNGQRLLPDSASGMILYQCSLLLLGVALFYGTQHLFARVESPLIFFYVLVGVVAAVILVAGGFSYGQTLNEWRWHFDFWPLKLPFSDSLRLNNLLAFALLGIAGGHFVRLKQLDSVGSGRVVQGLLLGGTVWFVLSVDYPYLMLFLLILLVLFLKFSPTLLNAFVAVMLFLCVAYFVLSTASGYSCRKWLGIYVYHEQIENCGYQTAQILRDIERGGAFGQGLFSYQPDSQSSREVLLDAIRKFLPQILSYEFGYVAMGIMATVVIGLFCLFRRTAKLFKSEEMRVIFLIGELFLLVPMILLLLRTYNLLPLIPSFSFPFMGYGVDAILVNYLVLGIMAGALRKDSVRKLQI